MGAAFVPEERLGHGAAPRMKLSENALLTGHAASGMVKRGFINKPATLAHVDRTHQDASTCARPSAIRKPSSLSGGNLQKFVVGREILREPGVLVVSQPTWGVDAGAAATIRQALIDLAAPRRRRAGHQPGSRRAGRDRRPHRGDVSRHACRRRSKPREATREQLGLLMGGADPERADGEREAKHAVGA